MRAFLKDSRQALAGLGTGAVTVCREVARVPHALSERFGALKAELRTWPAWQWVAIGTGLALNATLLALTQ